MPINIPNDLPAWDTLEQENIFIMSEKRARSQDIRPLRILILNLMPKKIDTERQLLRMLSNSSGGCGASANRYPPFQKYTLRPSFQILSGFSRYSRSVL